MPTKKRTAEELREMLDSVKAACSDAELQKSLARAQVNAAVSADVLPQELLVDRSQEMLQDVQSLLGLAATEAGRCDAGRQLYAHLRKVCRATLVFLADVTDAGEGSDATTTD